MSKLKKSKIPLTIKTGTVDEFFTKVKSIMRAADKGEAIKPEHTVVFENPVELLHMLSNAKIKLINIIRKHPDSISNIAKAIKRNRAAVYRDIQELEKFGLVKTLEEVNPGHGRHKIVKVAADRLRLEAYI